jgi:hypothetical protein
MVTAAHPPMLSNLPFYLSRGSPGLTAVAQKKQPNMTSVFMSFLTALIHNVRQEDLRSPRPKPRGKSRAMGLSLL